MLRLVCKPYPALRRQFASTCRTQAPPRFYRYVVDVHGQLFLHDTTPKNLTSCFKNPQFLDFFFARIKPIGGGNYSKEAGQQQQRRGAEEEGEDEWTEREDLNAKEADDLALQHGYRWVSPCQGETNFVRAAKSAIVFRELDEDGTLRWAGSFTCAFHPASLRVDPETGYVYHPSPLAPLNSVRKRVEKEGEQANPFGPYSLLSSALVLQRLAGGLDVDPDAFAEGKGGSIEWKGQRWDMGIIEEGDLL